MGGAIRALIETPRLALREMTLGDLDFVAGMLGDSRVMRFYPKTYSRKESEAWVLRQIGRYEAQGHGLWLAIDFRNDTPVGQVGLVRQEVDGVFADEIGYLLDARFWGQGFATEAACATRDHAFGALRKDRVISLIRPVNLASQAVARRVGLTPGPPTVFAGLEHIVFSLDRAGWLDLRKGPPETRGIGTQTEDPS